MPALSVLLRRSAIAVCVLLLLVTLALVFGKRREPTTQPVKIVPDSLVGRTASPPAAEQPGAQQPAIVRSANAQLSAPLPRSLPVTLTDDTDIAELRLRALAIPVQGIDAARLSDTFTQARAAGAPHEALDIMAARGIPVLAVESGQVVKLFLSKAGGLTIYQFDPSGRYAYYYAHLDRYAEGIREGASLRKGEVIGYVGSTGNAAPDAPHLHFAIFKLGPERQWWRGEPLNPFLVWRDAKQ